MLSTLALIFGSIFGFAGTATKAIFDWKGAQAKTVQNALDIIKAVDTNDATVIAAQANAISIILTQGSWLEKQWRPWLMIILMAIIGCWFFGYVPPHFNDEMSPMMLEVLGLLKIGVLGYIPCRTIEKVMTQLNVASVLKQLISKRVL